MRQPMTARDAFKRLAGFVVFALAGILIGKFTHVGQWLTIEKMEELSTYLGHWGVIVLFVLGVITPLLFIPRWPIAFVSGLLYGVALGAALATVSSAIGAWLHFELSRTLLAPAAQRMKEHYGLNHLQVPKNKQFLVIFLMRAFPFSSFVVTNLVAGALRIHSGRFIVASVLGMIPSSIMYAAGGKLMKQPSHEFYWLTAGVVILVVAGTVAAQRWLMPLLKNENEHTGHV
jgi:uncharacterized membrane protein YdjX (TVP38/TMEM64 family)